MKISRKIFIGFALMALASIGFALWYFFIPKIISPTKGLPLRAQLAAKIPTAVLLWSENGVVTGTNLKRWKPIPITKGENPRWSPDGRQFVFTRPHDVWLMKNDLSDPVKIISDVVTETGAGGYWTESGESVVAISRKNPKQVIKLELASGKIHIIHNENRPPYKGFRLAQCAELRKNGRYLLTFTRDAGHKSMIIDLLAKRYIANDLMLKGDCEPAWSPDGRFIVMTRRVRTSMNRPLYITKFNSRSGELSVSEYLVGQGRCHYASVSNDSNYVLYVSSGKIFCWRIKDSVEKPQNGVQLTFADQSSGPNLYIFPGKPPKVFRN